MRDCIIIVMFDSAWIKCSEKIFLKILNSQENIFLRVYFILLVQLLVTLFWAFLKFSEKLL